MDYSVYLKECEGKTPTQIKNIALDCCEKFKLALATFNFDFANLAEAFFYAALLTCHSDGNFDAKEVKFLNDINNKFGFGKEEQTVASAKKMLIENYSGIVKLVAGLYETIEKINDNYELYQMYKSYTNGMTLLEVLVRYFCALVSINGSVTNNEVDFLDALVAGTLEIELDTYDEDYGQTQQIHKTESEPPKVIKVGASLHKTEYNTYFSVGAEILVEGEDAIDLDVRVQLLDSTGFILESFDETINYIERGVFHFGREYNIDCNPSSFKVICGARDRGELKEEYKTSKVFRCTGMRFTRNGGYSDSYNIACMLENVSFYDGRPEAEIFVTFYDAADNIVGGARLDGEHLYLNQPDRYESTIDCVPVVNRTHMFRWSIDIYSVR